MKKKYLITVILFLGIFVTGGVNPIGETPGQDGNDLIRLHVLANSDSEEDQTLKYVVKDAIVKEIANKFNKSENIDESRTILLNSLPQVEDIAINTLKSLGSNYNVETQYGRFFFPTKYYGSFSLPAGEYEAVKVVIGEGRGANWWCVLFPPLCFVPTDNSPEEVSKVKNGYPVNTPDKFKKNNIRVSFKIVQWAKKSFPTLARMFN